MHEHSHTHDHAHCHAAAEGMSRWRLGFAVALTLAFVVSEAIAGALANSLALLSDAGHNFADAAALALSWYALWIASKPAHQGMTYGYHRVGILAALVNAVSLVVIALLIVWDAMLRFQHPEPPRGWIMVGVATLAIVVNVVISFWLRAGAKNDINVRSAYLHMLGDALSACGVVAAGVIVALTGSPIADPIASLLIAGLVLASSWGILKESVTILLEGTPVGMDMALVERAISDVRGVEGIHDLHVWTVGPGMIACSCHIVVAEQSIREGQQVLRAVAERLHADFNINHSTVQVEVAGHESNEMYCTLRAGAKQPPCA
jgi:cobalt-zinc-cadmium efflux system protein